jgi:parvulin-like peptidyl-prolyl isomerase
MGMDARFFIRPRGAAAAAFLALGCASADTHADTPPAVVRPQAPVAPVTPPVVTPQPVKTVAASDATTADQGSTQVRVAAVIGTDAVITDDEVWQQVRQRASEYVQLTGPARDAKEKELFREELRKLIERELILYDFVAKVKKNKPAALDELKDETERTAAKQMREIMRSIRTANNMTSEDQVLEALKSQGVSVKAWKRQLERSALMGVYLNQLLRDKAKAVTLAQVQVYYATHQDEFKTDDRVKWQDLFVSNTRFNTVEEAKKYAEQVRGVLAGGADFAATVEQYGHGDSKLRKGDGLGEKRGEIQPAELEATVFAMKAGDLSAPVPTATGFHVVRVVEREVGGVRPFDEKTQTAVRMKLAQQVQKAEYDRLIEELWRKTTVKVIVTP